MPDLTPDQRRELGQTAEVFEMITEANPADVSALEALAEIYVKLGEREKLASVTARLVRARRNPTAATATATAPSPAPAPAAPAVPTAVRTASPASKVPAKPPVKPVAVRSEPRARLMPLGDLLVAGGLITRDQLAQALRKQKGSTEKLGSILVRMHFIIEKYYESGAGSMAEAMNTISSDLEGVEVVGDDDGTKMDVFELKESADEAPVVKLVNMVLVDAIQKGASDIHWEPYEKVFRIRFRIDGVLHEMLSPPKRLEAAITSRIKIMSNLDIAERRLPQDGRIKLRYNTREIDFRVSVLPTIFGEKAVLRILDKDALQLDLTKLGFDPGALEHFEKVIRQPHGMVLITGPTGSGKTTTLYSAIHTINSPEHNIMTAEDPVEYNLKGVNQVQINDGIGRTFASALRAFLRQDPDVILVGETRDLETAQISIRAALTGHLVFSTLHTNDSPSTIARLIDMGIPPFLVAASGRSPQGPGRHDHCRGGPPSHRRRVVECGRASCARRIYAQATVPFHHGGGPGGRVRPATDGDRVRAHARRHQGIGQAAHRRGSGLRAVHVPQGRPDRRVRRGLRRDLLQEPRRAAGLHRHVLGRRDPVALRQEVRRHHERDDLYGRAHPARGLHDSLRRGLAGAARSRRRRLIDPEARPSGQEGRRHQARPAPREPGPEAERPG